MKARPGIPPDLMARVTGRGPRLIRQHLDLVEEHFPNPAAIKATSGPTG